MSFPFQWDLHPSQFAAFVIFVCYISGVVLNLRQEDNMQLFVISMWYELLHTLTCATKALVALLGPAVQEKATGMAYVWSPPPRPTKSPSKSKVGPHEVVRAVGASSALSASYQVQSSSLVFPPSLSAGILSSSQVGKSFIFSTYAKKKRVPYPSYRAICFKNFLFQGQATRSTDQNNQH